jgi:hypothetical protein
MLYRYRTSIAVSCNSLNYEANVRISSVSVCETTTKIILSKTNFGYKELCFRQYLFRFFLTWTYIRCTRKSHILCCNLDLNKICCALLICYDFRPDNPISFWLSAKLKPLPIKMQNNQVYSTCFLFPFSSHTISFSFSTFLLSVKCKF